MDGGCVVTSEMFLFEMWPFGDLNLKVILNMLWILGSTQLSLEACSRLRESLPNQTHVNIKSIPSESATNLLTLQTSSKLALESKQCPFEGEYPEGQLRMPPRVNMEGSTLSRVHFSPGGLTAREVGNHSRNRFRFRQPGTRHWWATASLWWILFLLFA